MLDIPALGGITQWDIIVLSILFFQLVILNKSVRQRDTLHCLSGGNLESETCCSGSLKGEKILISVLSFPKAIM